MAAVSVKRSIEVVILLVLEVLEKNIQHADIFCEITYICLDLKKRGYRNLSYIPSAWVS